MTGISEQSARAAHRQPPPLPELDQILASMLMSRFAIRVLAAA